MVRPVEGRILPRPGGSEFISPDPFKSSYRSEAAELASLKTFSTSAVLSPRRLDGTPPAAAFAELKAKGGPGAARGPHRRRPCCPEGSAPQAARRCFVEAAAV